MKKQENLLANNLVGDLKESKSVYKIYIGDTVGNECYLQTSKVDIFTDLNDAVETYIAEVNYFTETFPIGECNPRNVYVELRKFDVNGDVIEWNVSDFRNINSDIVSKFKALAGNTLEGWLQSEYFEVD